MSGEPYFVLPDGRGPHPLFARRPFRKSHATREHLWRHRRRSRRQFGERAAPLTVALLKSVRSNRHNELPLCPAVAHARRDCWTGAAALAAPRDVRLTIA